jgi:spermidine/putrescine transport system substrate-binding protein
VLGVTAAGPFLAACGGENGNGAGGGGTATGGTSTELQLARPDKPVEWPIFEDNPPIESGLEPESGTLRIYNWNDYVWPRMLRRFEKEYGVKVELTTFSTADEATAKLVSGAVDFDVYFPTPDRLGRLVLGKILQPINLEYIPNLQNVWPSLQDPFYDRGSRYTVPYTIYTTGIGYRADHVAEPPDAFDNPYDVYFDERNTGKMWLLDDSREAIAHMLLRAGVTDVNTEDPAAIEAAKQELIKLIDLVNVKLSTNDYTYIPEGRATIHQAWSGSLISAPYYLPQGVGPEVLGFWFPDDGRGSIGNDSMAIPKSASNPVLAHHFLNFLLDEKHGYDNFVNFVGYQPPFTSIDPDRLVAEEVVPANLESVVVRESDFDVAYFLLELSPQGQTLWQNAWAEFKAGV